MITPNNDNNLNKIQKYKNITNQTMTLAQLTATNTVQSNNLFTLFAANIQSITKNFDELQIILDETKSNPNVIILGECWLKDNIGFEELINIKEYTTFYTKRNKNKSDGVVVYINENIEKYKITEIISETMTEL